MYTLEEKLQIIEQAKSFEELKNSGILPEPNIDDGYYFVSYSHRDFKRVIPEILLLQEAGVKIWYDRGLETGVSWLKDVCRKIASFYCKGVIVYASDSFCASDSCARELAQIAESNKSALLIQLEACVPQGIFPNFVLPFDAPFEDKIAALHALPKPELYEFLLQRIKGLGTCAILWKVNDRNIKLAEIPAFITIENKRYPVRIIGENAFAFCYNLYEVILPNGWAIVSHGAFSNCYSLKRVVLNRPALIQKGSLRLRLGIVESAFTNCTSLVSVEVPSHTKGHICFSNAFIGCTALHEMNLGDTGVYLDNCFQRCTALEAVILSKAQDKDDCPSVFYECSALKEVRYSEKTNRINIPARTFMYCTSLERIVLPKKLRGISERAFANCENLREIHLPPSTHIVNATAFENAKALKTVIVDSALTFPANGRLFSIEEVFPYAETFYFKRGLNYRLSEAFKELPSDRFGYTLYGRQS